MRIAIVRLSAMGDIIQSMIVLQFIKEYIPDSTIDWFVDEQFSDILKGAEYLDNIFPIKIKGVKLYEVPFRLIKLLRVIRNKGKYDLVIDPQGLIKSGLISRFIKANKRVGFHRSSSRESLSAIFYSDSYKIPYEENVIRRYIGLIEYCFNINIPGNKILNKESLFLSDRKSPRNQDDYVVFIIGASFESKIYPIEKFAEVSNSISANVVVVWHSDKEKILAEKLKKLSPTVNISKKLNLDALKNLISKSILVIGGDTGPTHLAWGMNIPSITLFGSTPMRRNFMQTSINYALDSDSKVNTLKINKNDDSIKNIEPSRILDLYKQIINR